MVSAEVAPHAGAWIETWSRGFFPKATDVAPHAGAWIETFTVQGRRPDLVSPLTQGRGLKRIEDDSRHRPDRVAPHAGAWIETLCRRHRVRPS